MLYQQILPIAFAAVFMAAMPRSGFASSEQSLACNGFLVGKGDSAESLLQKCGEPVHYQAVCVALSQIETRPIRSEAERLFLATSCVRMDEWFYDRGPSTFSAIVRLRNRFVESVRDGQYRQ